MTAAELHPQPSTPATASSCAPCCSTPWSGSSTPRSSPPSPSASTSTSGATCSAAGRSDDLADTSNYAAVVSAAVAAERRTPRAARVPGLRDRPGGARPRRGRRGGRGHRHQAEPSGARGPRHGGRPAPPGAMRRAFLGLGTNLGDREAELRRAVAALAAQGDVVAVSGLYETEPMGGPPQGLFLNLVVELTTDDSPERLLERCWALEATAKRVRTVRNGPRSLDADVLLVEGETRSSPELGCRMRGCSSGASSSPPCAHSPRPGRRGPAGRRWRRGASGGYAEHVRGLTRPAPGDGAGLTEAPCHGFASSARVAPGRPWRAPCAASATRSRARSPAAPTCPGRPSAPTC